MVKDEFLMLIGHCYLRGKNDVKAKECCTDTNEAERSGRLNENVKKINKKSF